MRRMVIVLAAVLVLTGCSASATPSPSPTASAVPTPTATPEAVPGEAIDALTLEQRVGQLFMVGTPVEGASADTLSAVSDRHVGNVFLHGRMTGGTDAAAALVAQFTALVSPDSTADIPLWVATDQEGGDVQVLRGPGFDDIPYAIDQGAMPATDLFQSATTWGRQLAAAGINMNLAPVADIVTSDEVRRDNPPIGALGRHYGYDEGTVAEKAGAFADGMRASGVLPTFKHFPGLGRVTSNTDFSAEVTDTVVTADSPDVNVYRSLTAAGPSAVMVGTAIYQNIDPTTPAAFSAPVVQLLREGVGFTGVVITDDLSAAEAAEQVSPADRAVLAISAGVDVVLASADPTVLPEMYDAVLDKAKSDPAFAALVDAAAARVLAAKAPLAP